MRHTETHTYVHREKKSIRNVHLPTTWFKWKETCVCDLFLESGERIKGTFSKYCCCIEEGSFQGLAIAVFLFLFFFLVVM